MKELTVFKNLTRLYVGSTKITDSCLKDLAQITSLRELTLSCRDSVTKEGVKNLEKALPNCTITHY